ncbi:hypothetical protein [Mesomycoplasma lagogenitalium]|uniref:Uncharacterized protein n=1 Tax=Mesomycoplasma lagogenitalium TaxID=171286 RepID=A0ABY8LVN8_9BACT|nr:hypothetical protein [Mesomycoplasma lagogenitalium]WGI36598.1 hypothetical protein QEG99_04000 [Mesomycoplasma lagogenitalium]
MKLTKWVYFPFIGFIIFYLIYKVFCDVNLLDRNRARKILFKIIISLTIIVLSSFPIILFLTWMFGLLYNTSKNSLYIAFYFLSVLLVFGILSTLSVIITKKSLKTFFNIENDSNFKSKLIYYSAKITNQKKYYQNLIKKFKDQTTYCFLSDDFVCESYDENEIMLNNPNISDYMENKYRKGEWTIYGSWLNRGILALYSEYDYFYKLIILHQKAINENATYVVKNVNKYLLFIRITSFILQVGFFIPLIYFKNDPIQIFVILSYIIISILICVWRFNFAKKKIFKIWENYYYQD